MRDHAWENTEVSTSPHSRLYEEQGIADSCQAVNLTDGDGRRYTKSLGHDVDQKLFVDAEYPALILALRATLQEHCSPSYPLVSRTSSFHLASPSDELMLEKNNSRCLAMSTGEPEAAISSHLPVASGVNAVRSFCAIERASQQTRLKAG